MQKNGKQPPSVAVRGSAGLGSSEARWTFRRSYPISSTTAATPATAPSVSLSAINKTSLRGGTPRELALHKVQLIQDLSEVVASLVSLVQRQPALRIVGEERFGAHLGR
jgi:hypothetical protein